MPGEENDFQSLQDVPHGRVEKVWYKSETLDGVTRRLHVYLPPNYEEISQNQNLPVLYLLHGGGDNDASWTTAGRANLILDNLYAAGSIEPMIVVMPAGHTGIPGFFMGAGYEQDPACRDLVHTIISYVDAHYPTLADRDHLAIAGLSMGGVQTLNTALWNPELFSYVFPMSTGYFEPNIKEIKENHVDVMTNAEINNFKVFKIYMGGETDIAYQNNLHMPAMFFTYFMMGLIPVAAAVVPSEAVPERLRAKAIGLITGFGEIIGGVLVPAVAGMLSDTYDASAFLWVAAALAVLTFLFSFKLEAK